VNNTTRNKLTLLGLFVLFFVPVLLAYLMATGVIDYKPQPSKNHGNLVTPPIEMRHYTSQPLLAAANEKWKLVYVAPDHCGERCRVILDAMYRIYLATGRHRTKVQPVVVSYMDDFSLPEPFDQRLAHVSIASDSKAQTLFERLSRQSLTGGKGLYIIAPEGFLMMSYPKEFSPSGVIKDMNILLKRKDG